jgi:hypothetical protein
LIHDIISVETGRVFVLCPLHPLLARMTGERNNDMVTAIEKHFPKQTARLIVRTRHPLLFTDVGKRVNVVERMKLVATT